MAAASALPLPRSWPRVVHRGVLHALSLAATAMTRAWSRAGSVGARTQRLQSELALLAEELALKDARWARQPPHRRPHYDPVQRMKILELRAIRGWSVHQTAECFLVTEETIMSWMRRVDEEGGFIRPATPISRFPDLVVHLVQRLRMTCPTLGKKKIAEALARAGLHLGVSTVGRMLKRDLPKDVIPEELAVPRLRRVKAKAPNDIWHLDLTAVPTAAGFWVPWFPFARLLQWPFAWWVAVAVDHASRLVVGFAVFARRPSSPEVASFLSRAIRCAGATPRTVITDHGNEFAGEFRRCCRQRGIRQRLGKVGEHGSIAIVERLIRSLKAECVEKMLVPFRMAEMRSELGSYSTWFNEHRPHEALGGRTPLEVYTRAPPANERPRFEPRPHWPTRARCAAPNAPLKEPAGARLVLVVRRLASKRHLPVIQIRRAV